MFIGLQYKMNFFYWFWSKKFSCSHVRDKYKVSGNPMKGATNV